MKTVTIIIPMYNAASYIEECLNSCLELQGEDVEIIVIDDGSTDGSDKIVKEYTGKVQYIRQDNLGGAVARNVGIERASGKYLFFLDADDIVCAGVLKTMLKKIQKDKCDICIGNYALIDEGGKKIRNENTFDGEKKLLRKDLSSLFVIDPNPSTKLYVREIVKTNNIRFGNVKMAQDLDFFLKYLSCCNSAEVINKCVYKYRILNGSISRTYDSRLLCIMDVFRDVDKFRSKSLDRQFGEGDLANSELLHIYYQICKIKFIKEYKLKRRVFKALKSRSKEIKACRNCSTYEKIKWAVLKLRILCFGNIGLIRR